ncbi:MAG: PIN domain-containing protein [Treponema sp.]|jgi:predicted nucleic acid-binding protein|nr:PIN domain-containing protein [Treponema sp.]
MPDRIFLDTNILLYTTVDDGSDKHAKCHNLLAVILVGSELVASVQVLNEYYVNALKKNIAPVEIQNTVKQFIADFEIVPLAKELIPETYRICNRYQFSYWDSNIVAAALEAKCTTLYTEDLQDGQVIDNTLTVVNPMLHSGLDGFSGHSPKHDFMLS